MASKTDIAALTKAAADAYEAYAQAAAKLDEALASAEDLGDDPEPAPEGA